MFSVWGRGEGSRKGVIEPTAESRTALVLLPGRYVLTGRAEQPGVFPVDPAELGDQGRNGFVLASYKHRSVTLSVVLFPAQSLFPCVVRLSRQRGSAPGSRGRSKLPQQQHVLCLARQVCRRWELLQQRAGKRETAPSSLPVSKHSKASTRMRRDKGEKGGEPWVARKLEDAWLSAGIGESTQTGLDF